MGTEGHLLLSAVDRDTAKAVCHEVVAVGPEVSKVEIGDHVLHISAAADAADYDKVERKNAKYLFCHQDDIVARWSFDEAYDITKKLKV